MLAYMIEFRNRNSLVVKFVNYTDLSHAAKFNSMCIWILQGILFEDYFVVYKYKHAHLIIISKQILYVLHSRFRK